MAAIFYFWHTRTSDSIPTSIFVFPDPENMGIAVEISLPSRIEAEIYVMSFLFRIMAAIFDFRLTQTSESLSISLSVLPAFEKMA